MRGAVALSLLAGCSFTPGVLGGGDAQVSDDATVVIDGKPCEPWALAPTGIDPCAVPGPVLPMDLCTPGVYALDTGSGDLVGGTPPLSTLLTASEPDIRVVILPELVVCSGVELRVVGPHAVAFLVHGRVEITGTIGVSAWLNGAIWQPGPGGETACTAGTGGTGVDNTGGAGGGGGGGFGVNGRDGGDASGSGGTGGTAEGTPSLTALRGGCAGGPGGNGDAPGVSTGGRGGGAIQIAARDSILINATGIIRASGGPGGGGPGADDGGGGGGAGGAILLEAPTVTNQGSLCANGGGGGGGASDGGNAGGVGELGTCDDTAASGGNGGSGGGTSGGNGGFGTTAAETGDNGSEGAGGGGGAVGRIRLRAAGAVMLGGTITPPPN